MVFKNEEKAKQLIVEIVSSEYVDIIPGKGLYFNDDIVYDKNFSHITNDDEYLFGHSSKYFWSPNTPFSRSIEQFVIHCFAHSVLTS